MPRISSENNNYYNKYRAPALENNNNRDGNTAEDVRKARYEAAQTKEADIRKREIEDNRRNRYTAEESVGGTINIRV
ncbi:MAG: hypothetical protein HY279_08975 [Nitrospinae bacterium]|nr:hypothetical protein [Nitrospinota bacterium]